MCSGWEESFLKSSFYSLQERENDRGLPAAGVDSDEDEARNDSTQVHGQQIVTLYLSALSGLEILKSFKSFILFPEWKTESVDRHIDYGEWKTEEGETHDRYLMIVTYLYM